ncbi:MAG: type II toxin-antitoxin system HicB family antitoxin [Armatimonadota bacterium]
MEEGFTIIFEPAEEGGYTAFIPEAPGVVSEGETLDEARAMVLDALAEMNAYRREKALGTASPHSIVERKAV